MRHSPATPTIYDRARSKQYAHAVKMPRQLLPHEWAALNDYAFQVATRYLRMSAKRTAALVYWQEREEVRRDGNEALWG